MRRSLSLLLALFLAPSLFAESKEPPPGRSLDQRFGKFDQSLVFDPRQGAVGEGRSFYTRNAQTSSFQYDQKVAPEKFNTREFAQPKTSWLSKLKFWTKNADAREFADGSKQAATKSAPVKEARDAARTVDVRDVHDGRRAYLGPESEKLKTAVDAKTMADWRSGGESVSYTGRTVERYGNLKPLSVEDVREILNKNK